MNKRPLGRGLDSLIPKSLLGGKTLMTLNIDDIVPSQLQPRHQFDEQELMALAHTIQEHGLIQPIVVRSLANNKYEIIAGERRFRACKRINLKTIQAIVKDSPDDAVLKIAMIENMHRESLSPLDIAKGYQQLITQFSMTHAELAVLFSKNRSTISNTLRLLKLVPEVQQALTDKTITEGHARLIAGIKPTQQPTVLAAIIQNKLSVREAEQLDTASIKPKPKPRKTPANLVNYAKEKSKQINLPVRITGTAEKGKVILQYHSESERKLIEALLDKDQST